MPKVQMLNPSPTPWSLDRHVTIRCAGGRSVAVATRRPSVGEWFDNARLMLAAPALYAACVEIIEADNYAEAIGVTLDDHMNRQRRREILDAAVAQAHDELYVPRDSHPSIVANSGTANRA